MQSLLFSNKNEIFFTIKSFYMKYLWMNKRQITLYRSLQRQDYKYIHVHTPPNIHVNTCTCIVYMYIYMYIFNLEVYVHLHVVSTCTHAEYLITSVRVQTCTCTCTCEHTILISHIRVHTCTANSYRPKLIYCYCNYYLSLLGHFPSTLCINIYSSLVF